MLSKQINKIICTTLVGLFALSFCGQNTIVYAITNNSVTLNKIAPTNSVNYLPNRIIVKYKSNTNVQGLSTKKNDTVITNNNKVRVAKIQIETGKTVSQKIQEYKADPSVEYAEPDYIMSTTSTNDSYYSYQWSIPKTKTDQAWDKYTGSSNVVVAVIDTGIKTTHEDLSSSIVGGYNEITKTTNVEDDNGHGTHVSGIAAGIKNNAIGIAGVASGCKIMPIKVMNSSGSGYTSDILDGVVWATDNYQAKGGQKLVISMSLGGAGYSQAFQDAINYAHSKGVIVIAAAGNSNVSTPSYPAAYENVISVVSTDENNNKSSFSNYGSTVDISAPGSNIFSTTFDGGYGYMSGTSMATPFVAGEAALVWSNRPELTESQLEEVLQTSVVDLGQAGKDTTFGYGLVDVNSAMTKQVDTSGINLKIASTSATTFSPYKTKFTLNYTLGTNAYVTYKIYDSNNVLVRTLLDKISKVSGASSIQWDGKNNSGQVVSNGTYTYAIGAVNAFGTNSTVLTGTVLVDGVAPVITNLTASKSSTQDIVNISYTTDEAGKVSTAIYNSSNVLVKQLESSVLKNAGTYSLTWDAKNNYGQIVPDDTYTVKVSDMDSLGNISPTATNTSFVFDIRNPLISNYKVDYLSFRPLGTNLDNISYTISEKANMTVKIYDVNDNLVRTLENDTIPASSKKIGWNGKNDAGQIVSDGTYTYKINATDMVSKVASQITGTIKIDTTTPVISNVSLDMPQFAPTGSNTLGLTYTTSETSAVNVSIYNSNNMLVKQLENVLSKAAGTYSLTWDGKNNAGQIVPDDTYSMKVISTDSVYLKASVSTQSIIVDSRMPVISNYIVQYSSFRPLGTNLDYISYAISEKANMTVKIYDVNDNLVRTLENDTIPASSKKIGWDGKNDAGQIVSDGTYTYKIKAVDVLGKTTNDMTGTIKIDTTTPVISNVSLNMPQFAPSGSNALGLTYTTSETSAVNVSIYNSSNILVKQLENVLSKAAGTYSLTWDGKNNYGQIVPDDTYSMKITSTDGVYLKASVSTQAIIVDSRMPVISNYSVQYSSFRPLGTNLDYISYIVSEKANMTVKIYDVNDNLVRTLENDTIPASSKRIGWDGKNDAGQIVSDGTYTYKIKAVDVLGKTTNDMTGTIKIDTIAPVLSNPSLSATSFHPNGLNNVSFNYSLSENSKVIVNIINSTNGVIKTIESNVTKNAGVNSAIWNGKNNYGAILSYGTYRFSVIAIDPAGLSTTLISQNINII